MLHSNGTPSLPPSFHSYHQDGVAAKFWFDALVRLTLVSSLSLSITSKSVHFLKNDFDFNEVIRTLEREKLERIERKRITIEQIDDSGDESEGDNDNDPDLDDPLEEEHHEKPPLEREEIPATSIEAAASEEEGDESDSPPPLAGADSDDEDDDMNDPEHEARARESCLNLFQNEERARLSAQTT